jgi:hypothetical protein
VKGGFPVQYTDRFSRDYSGLSDDIKDEVDKCLRALSQDPIPGSRRPHSVTPRGKKPTIFTVDVTSNKAYKLSFHFDGAVAVLRRIATHGEIDRKP